MMNLSVEIDRDSGFCGGVVRAIGTAEKFLDAMDGRMLFSLGAIVHNEEELRRLEKKGLVSVDVSDLEKCRGESVLIRAHGEPPRTYSVARGLGINLIDCTCPVVLQLQKQIREAYGAVKSVCGQIVIFGKIGHAEVLGLVGQVDGDAVVVENVEMLKEYVSSGKIRTDAPVALFSQTTKNPLEYEEICRWLSHSMMRTELLTVHRTICVQVANRHMRIMQFAAEHDVIVFVTGSASSNGRVLSDLCRSVNPNTVIIKSVSEISPSLFSDGDRVGICGATSTPKWLLEDVASAVEKFAL